MQHAVKATAPILVVLTAVVLAVQLVGTPTDQTDAFPWTAGALLIAIGVVAHLRRWQTTPWLPWAGLAVTAAMYATNNEAWMYTAFWMTTLSVLWHEHQRERPRREVGRAPTVTAWSDAR